ncbi:MAG: aldo/keto reductase [Nitrososphaerota archaeon]|nr:aldo/keto reductase [Nitrososphaerota archaeon]MDG6924283.1 aldo/keto reductase [Nitrososphaerota archaeon]
MNRKLLGNTSVRIPEIGQGTWNYKGGIEPLRLGVSLGATHVDTAEIYGTEGVVGKAIDGMRDQVFLATKVWPDHLSYDDVLKACEGSLDRLGVKHVDLYMIHWPNPEFPIRETMRAMEELVKKGKIKYIGVSNFSVAQLKEAQRSLSTSSIVSNQVKYNLDTRGIEEDLIPYCKSEKITIVAYSPLKGSAIKQKDGILDEIAQKYGKTRAQVILNFLTSEDNVVAIPKADNPTHVKENCGGSGWRLSKEDRARISEEFKF